MAKTAFSKTSVVADTSKYKQYPAFKIYPFFHKGTNEEMMWAGATVVEMDKVKELIFVAASTGRDPEKDREPKTFAEERRGVGVVVGGIKEQTATLWERIKEVLEAVGAKLDDTWMYRRRYIVDRPDWFPYLEAEHKWWQEHAPDEAETFRPGVGLKGGLELNLPDQLIEVDCIAVTAKK